MEFILVCIFPYLTVFGRYYIINFLVFIPYQFTKTFIAQSIFKQFSDGTSTLFLKKINNLKMLLVEATAYCLSKQVSKHRLVVVYFSTDFANNI